MKFNYFLSLVVLVVFSSHAQEVYIAQSGNDANPGTKNKPLATLTEARNKARSNGSKTIWIRGGRYKFTTTTDLDARDNGLKISGYQNEKVIYDGAEYFDPNQFKKVTDAGTLNRLNDRAKKNVYEIAVKQKAIQELLEQPFTQLSMDDIMIHIARFPNIGYAHIDVNSINNSSEKINKIGHGSQVNGASFKLFEKFNANQWSKELNTNNRVRVTGYYSADWLKENSPIASVASSGSIRLKNGSRYGLKNRGSKRPLRLYITNMLYELDEPGEWFYDTNKKKIFIWPLHNKITNTSKIGVWAGPKLIHIKNAKNIKIQNFTVQHVSKGSRGDGVIDIRNSESCEVAGVKFRYIDNLAVANIINGKKCGIKSSDIFDCSGGFRCYGGEVSASKIIAGKNYIENCHYTQIYSKDFYGKMAALKGAGNIFRNNLIHNTNGQPFTYDGVDHVIELNEAFNTGIEEGDGGVFYTGNSIWSFGTVLRHNFIHHNMSVPGLLGKGGFHFDDFDAGKQVKGNVFYKGGWAAVKFNKSGGQSIMNNVILKGFLGVRINTYRQSFYDTSINYLKRDPNNKIKANYIGRMLQAIGNSGWQNGLNETNWYNRVSEFWKKRYPTMDIMMKKYRDNKNMHAYETRIYDNLFHKNTKGKLGIYSPKSAEKNNKEIGIGVFQNPANLNFKFKNKPTNFPNIPFEKIGLYKDAYRCAVPNKDQYRKNVKNHFADRPAHDPKAQYNRNTINQTLYYNTGKMVFNLLPCYNDGVVNKPDSNAIVSDEYRYDLGTKSSPIFKGYELMTNKNTLDYNWSNLRKLKIADRGNINSANVMNQDFVFGEGISNTLTHNVENGLWHVIVTWGDAKDPRDKMSLTAEGKMVANNVRTKAGEFKNSDFKIEVTDKKLDLLFSDNGGVNNRWSITRIWLRKIKKPVSAVMNKAPIGKYISLQKAGGNRAFISAEPKSNRLIANRTKVQQWETFLVEKHPKGGVALKALSTNKYVQVSGKNKDIPIEPDGNRKLRWEQFEWKTIGNGKVALKSLHSGKWLQAAWNNNNSLVKAAGDKPGNWETFNWKLTSGKKILVNELSKKIEIYPVPTHNVLTIDLGDITLENYWTCSVFDSLGRLIEKIEKPVKITDLDVSNYDNGVYFIVFDIDGKIRKNKTFIKN
ncbi:T9SS type A sorting domain-containing protein [Aquimarina agarilytica]|uniref:T9SS type A sorting domain-containing protein n=1 Tax=Aquimarina agarilytica TaxID=1087449 RepID=UPI00028A3846|nr:T9SS type A sorting domain-containing protein [Aquimarina agarilytica]